MLPSMLGDPGMQLVLAIMAGATGFKIWLRFKHDVRTDGRGESDKRSSEDIAGTYSKLVLDLQKEVSRLAEAVSMMSSELDVERIARRSAEQVAASAEHKANNLTLRVQHLEQVLKHNGIEF